MTGATAWLVLSAVLTSVRPAGATEFERFFPETGFGIWNDAGSACCSNNCVYARCREQLKLAVQPGSKKHIAREQRQRKLFGSIFPSVNSGIQRQEYFKPSTGKKLSDHLLALVPRVQRMPGAVSVTLGGP